MEELLKASGFKDEEIAEKSAALKKAMAGKWIPQERLAEESEKVKKLEGTIKDRDKQITDLKKLEGLTEEQKTKIADLEKANKDAKTEYEASVKKLKLETAVKSELSGKVHDVAVTMNLLDLTKVEIDEEKGTIKSGFKEQFDNLKKDKAFLFVEEKKQPEKKEPFKPAGNPPKEGDDNRGGSDSAAVAFAKGLAKTGQAQPDAVKVYFKN